MSRLLINFLLLVLMSPSVWATTWYIRDGGGTPTQCTGTTNAVYPGSGTNQACALIHPSWLFGTPNTGGNGTTGVGPTATTGLITGGDTVYIVGDSDVSSGSQAQYFIGYGMPNTVSYQCGSLQKGACFMAAIPPGPSSSQQTVIKGIGTHQPQLYGDYNLGWVLDLSSSTTPSSGTLSVVSGNGDSSIGYSASYGQSYNFSVSGITNAPAIGDKYTSPSPNSNTFTIRSINLSGSAGSISGNIVATSSGPPYASTGLGYSQSHLTVVSGHGSGDSTINYANWTFSNFSFLVSGITTAPSGGDEYTTGSQTYDIVSSNISSGSGTIQANKESNLDVENIEITQHQVCSGVMLQASGNAAYNGLQAYCNGQYGIQAGLELEGINLTTKKLWVHNSGSELVNFPGVLGNWSDTASRWDAAGASLTAGGSMAFNGTNTLTNDVWAFGGCMEKYPLPDPTNVKDTTNYINCMDQNAGDYALGGGFMMQNNTAGTCGNWTINNSQFLFNLKTNIDFLHCDGSGTFNLYRSRSEGSSGEAIKVRQLTVNLEEDQLIGNAPVWNQSAFQSIAAYYDNNGDHPWQNSPPAGTEYFVCRGRAVNIFWSQANATVNYINDDVTGNCTSLIETSDQNNPSSYACTGMAINAYNSKFLAGYGFDIGEKTDLYYVGGSDGNGTGNCGTNTIPLNLYYNNVYNNLDSSVCASPPAGGTSSNNLCNTDPSVVGESSQGAFTYWLGPTAYYSGTSLGDLLYLQSSSPLRNAGTTPTYVNSQGDLDYNLYTPFDSPVDMGALQYDSCVSTSNGTTTGFCSSSQCCSGNTCSSGMCTSNSSPSSQVVSCQWSGHFRGVLQ